MKRNAKDFRRMKQIKWEKTECLESKSDSDDEEVSGWDEVGLLVENFVDLNDTIVEIKEKELSVEKMIASAM